MIVLLCNIFLFFMTSDEDLVTFYLYLTNFIALSYNPPIKHIYLTFNTQMDLTRKMYK